MSKYKFLIVHGSKGSPQGNWFTWLKQKLEEAGHSVSSPAFPTPENQSFNTWLDVANKHIDKETCDHTILIGHSTGAVFVLRLAEMSSTPFHAVFSVCPFTEDLNLEEYDVLNKTFVQHDFNWQKVRQGAKKICLLAGDNDPYVPVHISEKVAENLKVTLNVIKDGGHLNAESGYTSFEHLLAVIQKTL